ncbi:DUF1000-domain-containing protein [Laetiporus sulphureus 93-53]|uniref:DUF1000-domain-containing protein n=1 Tax=Laetiporus sulphureus 93-53 TaxID=1314785 RepID=A0A165AYZ0_9APHY|nr:DUF1000-domain-containing protein [Laetiporus sulphureus 93-53]KZS99919.1 DUF1000-domain-containing protein [Laetiporus sulphureus 93-53]
MVDKRTHGSCGDESHSHDHHHDIPEAQGVRDNLYAHIDRPNVVALNADPGKGPEVIKPWDQRLDEETFLESDADDQMIIRVPFTGSVKLRAVLLKAGPGEHTPAKVKVYSNLDNGDFSNIADAKPVQEFGIAQGREIGEYHVMPAKFPNVTSLTLFFPSSQGAHTMRIYYLGFIGQWSERKNEPVIAVYEARARLVDHPQKIQGIDGHFVAPDQAEGPK